MVGFVKSALNLFGLNKTEGSSSGGITLDDFLKELPSHLGMDLEFKRTEKAEPGVFFEVVGPEAEVFMGENCETLDALSHICMRVLRRSEGLSNTPATETGEGLRVVFDSAGFRDRNAEALKNLAKEQRQKVIDSGGKPSYIKALGPADRKIIHTTLVDLGEVVSESIGRGNFKRIRIKLKDDSPLRREQPSREAQGDAPAGVDDRGPRRHGSGGSRRRSGGQQQGQGGNRRFGGGRGGSPNRGHGRGKSSEFEPNGNVAPDLNEYGTEADSAEDNVGNRLAPGETPLYPFNSGNRGFNPGQN